MFQIGKLLKEKGLKDARNQVQENPKQYKNAIKKLILDRKLEGVAFGRFYLDDPEIKHILDTIMDDERLGLSLRIQALYEILTEESTPEVQKEKGLILFSDIDKFKEICIQAYDTNNDDKKEAYQKNLIKEKIPNTPLNKKWVYLFELVVLYREKPETKQLLSDCEKYPDNFMKKVVKQCLEYLKAE